MCLSPRFVISDLVYVVQQPALPSWLCRWTFYPGLATSGHSDWFGGRQVKQLSICLVLLLTHFGKRSSNFVRLLDWELLNTSGQRTDLWEKLLENSDHTEEVAPGRGKTLEYTV